MRPAILFFVTALAASPSVIIDTDAGSDDMLAISYLLAHKELKIEAIVVANGLAHVEPGARNLLRLCALAGRDDIPVYIGASKPSGGNREFPEAWRKGSDELGAKLPDAHRKPETETAAAFYKKRLSRPSPDLQILALGPLTNFNESAALLKDVGEVVIMGGAIEVPGNLGDGGFFKTSNTTAEWNIYVDPASAAKVFGSGARIRLIPLDATNRVKIEKPYLEGFQKDARSPLARYVADVLEANREYIEKGFYYAWDPLAAVALLHPDVAKFTKMTVSVKQKAPEDGRTAKGKGRSNTQVALDADSAKFDGFYRRALIP